MLDPYLYPHAEVLKNLAGIKDEKMLASMEADYLSDPNFKIGGY